MGKITANVPDEVLLQFREGAKRNFGRQKYMQKALVEAMQLWNKSKYHDRCMELLKKRVPTGKWKMPTRDEIHDRKIL
ncbi:MAG: hypothetical protein OXR66_03425 [Candidatus Woesearchaeota archaeon]|nr:hypothetical protein [Candidatus Woesearchaeota archaeon]